MIIVKVDIFHNAIFLYDYKHLNGNREFELNQNFVHALCRSFVISEKGCSLGWNDASIIKLGNVFSTLINFSKSVLLCFVLL